MRRITPFVLALALATGTVAAIASGDDGSRSAGDDRRAEHRAHHGRGFHRALHRAVIRSLSDRLGVERKPLRTSVRAVVREQRRAHLAAAGVTDAELAALKACRRGHHRMRRKARRARCDRAAARSARTKLRAHEPDLAAIKQSASASLAAKLGVSQDDLLTGIRAELAARLDQAVMIGFVTERGRELALACFDAPAGCDRAELRREIRHRRR